MIGADHGLETVLDECCEGVESGAEASDQDEDEPELFGLPSSGSAEVPEARGW